MGREFQAGRERTTVNRKGVAQEIISEKGKGVPGKERDLEDGNVHGRKRGQGGREKGRRSGEGGREP